MVWCTQFEDRRLMIFLDGKGFLFCPKSYLSLIARPLPYRAR